MKVYLLDQVIDKREEPQRSLHWTEHDAKEQAVQNAERHGWNTGGVKADTDTAFAALKQLELMYPIKTDIVEMELPELHLDFESKHADGDAHLKHSRTGSVEYHWRDGLGKGTTVVMAYYPQSYPQISVWTMTNQDSRESVAKLLSDNDGWERDSQMNDPEEIECAECEDDGE